MKQLDIDYEASVDSFAKTVHVKSSLLFGNLDYIEEPLFTIFIPTYRRPHLLKDALKSVINQWHVSFSWDIVILDNDAYDGRINETEKLVRKIDNPRILYYRNSEHMRPGDNFNRGILLSRGKWVMILHDDDILFGNSLQNMGRVVKLLERNSRRTIGAINVMNHQFKYDKEHQEKHLSEIYSVQNYYLSLPTNFWLYKLTHWNILFTGHIGGNVPSNGATYNRAAVIDIGGFNENFGISADLILNYQMENKYDVYSTTVPYGFYRWGENTMAKSTSTYDTIKAGYDFREYVYGKNIFNMIWGALFRASQYRRFTLSVIEQKRNALNIKQKVSDFDGIYAKRPNKHLYAFYVLVIRHLYDGVKYQQMKKLYKKSLKDKELWE